MTNRRLRLQVQEYGQGVDLSSQIAVHTRNNRNGADRILQEAGQRIANNLKLGYNPIEIEGINTRVKDISGIIQLGPAIELEIVPKFLNASKGGKWREDFFFLATLSRYGRLLNHDKISTSSGESKNVSTLIARSYSNMYQENRRRPLRKYQRVRTVDFAVDGDVDPIEIAMPSAEGYEQENLKFTKVNNWNSILQAAAFKLLGEVSDPKVASNLTRLIEDYAGQPKPNLSRIKQIPSRQRIWKPVFDLAVDILKDLSLQYEPGSANSPGFLINSWQTWENLLSLSIKIGFKNSAVNSQKPFNLGTRHRVSAPAIPVKVFPDCFIHANGILPDIIIDAKYKGNIDRGSLRISESDLYESLAFSKATNCNNIVLAYPAHQDTATASLGSCSLFERIEIGPLTIFGLQVNVNSISQKNGLQIFSNELAKNITDMFK